MAVSRSTFPVHSSLPADSQHYSDSPQQRAHQPSNGTSSVSGSSVPPWYEASPFQYNGRIMAGFAPGLLLLGVVLGKTFFAVLLFGLMVLLLLRSLGYDMATLVATVITVFSCQIMNFYIMVPLMWHSALNIPMFMLLNVFIAIAGTWALLLNTEFLKQDPRIVLMVEKGLFVMIPGLDLAMVGWVCGLIWGKEYLPLVLGVAGIAICSVFITPLQSSFAKQRTPQDTGLILPPPVALSYIALVSFLPGILNAALDHRSVFTSPSVFVKYQAYFACPLFAVSLLEAQGVFNWFGAGVNGRIIKYFRLSIGFLVMCLMTNLVYKALPSSTSLPSLAVLLVFGLLALTVSLDSDHTHLPLPSLLLAGVVSVLYFVSSFEMRWTTSYTFSLLSIPYFLVQLLLLLLGCLSVILVLTWRRDLTVLWPTYHAVFVGCEFILHKDSLYPVPMLLCTATAAVLLCLRLHRVGRLPLPITLMCVILHVVKLFQVLPLATPILSAVSLVGVGLVGAGLLKLSSSNKHSLIMWCICSVVVTTGLALCIETLLSPLLTSITHTPPSGADLAAVVLLVSGYLMQLHLPSLSHSKYYSLPSHLPSSLYAMAMLVWGLQVDFDLVEVAKAVAMIAVHHADVNSFIGQIVTSEQLSLMAWLVLVKWVVVAYAGITMATIILSDIITIIPLFAAIWLLGSGVGMLSILTLAHHTPLSLLGGLYAIYGSTVALLVAVVANSNMLRRGNTAVYSLFLIVVALPFVLLPWELSMPQVAGVHAPGSIFIAIGFATIAVTMKVKSLITKAAPTYPIICNTSCLVTYLLLVMFPLPIHLDHTLLVSLTSCIMLLAQPDGILVPRGRGLFLAPSLLLSSLTLFTIILKDTMSVYQLTVGYVVQLVCLLASMPGQLKLINCLWRDTPLRFTLVSFMMYVGPNACIAQLGGNPSVVYGSAAVLCYSLLIMGELQTLKTI